MRIIGIVPGGSPEGVQVTVTQERVEPAFKKIVGFLSQHDIRLCDGLEVVGGMNVCEVTKDDNAITFGKVLEPGTLKVTNDLLTFWLTNKSGGMVRIAAKQMVDIARERVLTTSEAAADWLRAFVREEFEKLVPALYQKEMLRLAQLRSHMHSLENQVEILAIGATSIGAEKQSLAA